MPQRLAGTMSLLAFVFCLLVGGFSAENALSTVIYRALMAMAGTFFVALLVGWMAQKMINENVASMKMPAPPPPSANSARQTEKIIEISEAK